MDMNILSAKKIIWGLMKYTFLRFHYHLWKKLVLVVWNIPRWQRSRADPRYRAFLWAFVITAGRKQVVFIYYLKLCCLNSPHSESHSESYTGDAPTLHPYKLHGGRHTNRTSRNELLLLLTLLLCDFKIRVSWLFSPLFENPVWPLTVKKKIKVRAVFRFLDIM